MYNECHSLVYFPLESSKSLSSEEIQGLRDSVHFHEGENRNSLEIYFYQSGKELDFQGPFYAFTNVFKKEQVQFLASTKCYQSVDEVQDGDFVLNLSWIGILSYLSFRPPRLTEPFARSLKLHRCRHRAVDSSCGQGKDALYMAFMKAEVYAFERHPVIFFLLDQAKKEALHHFSDNSGILEVLNRLHINFGDPSNSIPESFLEGSCWYYDPMFDPAENSRSKRRPKKEMSFFQDLIAETHQWNASEDIVNNLRAFIASGARRYILKRPLRAKVFEPELDLPVRFESSYVGKSVRYDFYVKLSRFF